MTTVQTQVLEPVHDGAISREQSSDLQYKLSKDCRVDETGLVQRRTGQSLFRQHELRRIYTEQ